MSAQSVRPFSRLYAPYIYTNVLFYYIEHKYTRNNLCSKSMCSSVRLYVRLYIVNPPVVLSLAGIHCQYIFSNKPCLSVCMYLPQTLTKELDRTKQRRNQDFCQGGAIYYFVRVCGGVSPPPFSKIFQKECSQLGLNKLKSLLLQRKNSFLVKLGSQAR